MAHLKGSRGSGDAFKRWVFSFFIFWGFLFPGLRLTGEENRLDSNGEEEVSLNSAGRRRRRKKRRRRRRRIGTGFMWKALRREKN